MNESNPYRSPRTESKSENERESHRQPVLPKSANRLVMLAAILLLLTMAAIALLNTFSMYVWIGIT